MIALKQFSQLVHAQYTQGRIAADAVFRIFQRTADVLATFDNDNDDLFLTSDDEDELEANELIVSIFYSSVCRRTFKLHCLTALSFSILTYSVVQINTNCI